MRKDLTRLCDDDIIKKFTPGQTKKIKFLFFRPDLCNSKIFPGGSDDSRIFFGGPYRILLKIQYTIKQTKHTIGTHVCQWISFLTFGGVGFNIIGQ